MKKKFHHCLIFLLPIFSTLNAQIDLQYANMDALGMQLGATRILRNNKSQGAKIQGSPYLQKTFALAQVEKVTQKYYMRYNVYGDEFEFITPQNDTLILDKIKDFDKITFVGNNKKYVLTDYLNFAKKNIHGYLIMLHNKGPYTLFLKENISYYDGKVAKTSMERDMPARYVPAESTYYLKNNEQGIVEFPENKKQLLKLFPEKKTEIENFLKEQNITFDEEYNKIKIIDFLATL